MQTYTSGEIQKLLGIPGSTLRRYVTYFKEYLSPDARKRRSSRFTEDDMFILGQVRDLTEQGKRFEDIAPLLKKVKITKRKKDEFALNTISKRFDEIGGMFTDQQRDINDIRGDLHATQDRLDRLARELEAERSKSLWDKLRGR